MLFYFSFYVIFLSAYKIDRTNPAEKTPKVTKATVLAFGFPFVACNITADENPKKATAPPPIFN